MIITCQNCSSRLQVDETKVPARPFTIRCPKCNSSVDTSSPVPALEESATSASTSPASENPRFDQPTPAPLYEPQQEAVVTSPAASVAEKLAELLSGLMDQPMDNRSLNSARHSWNPRKALICIAEENRELVAHSLAEIGYQVFVAQDTRQAVDRMRESLLDIVLLDPRFDQVEQGAIFVTREVSILRPAQRRRLFFVLLSPSLRTMDSHAAFLNNVNATININEIAELPQLMERRIREYNELYREFNSALGVPAL